MVGATNPQQATPGTIRGDYAVSIGRNIIHGTSKQIFCDQTLLNFQIRNRFQGSDSPESAEKEISLWFKDNEVTNYDRVVEKWIYEQK